MLTGESAICPSIKSSNPQESHSAGLLYLQNNSPIRRNKYKPSTGSLPPSLIHPSTDPHRSSLIDAALAFVQYQPTPVKPRALGDSPKTNLKFFESPTTYSPTWSQVRSFERWRLRDLSQHTFEDGRAGLEAEAEGYEPGEALGTINRGELQEFDKSAPSTTAGSITEEESQDVTEWLLRIHPELKFGGKAPP